MPRGLRCSRIRPIFALMWAPLAMGALLVGCGGASLSDGAANETASPAVTLTVGKEATPMDAVTIAVAKTSYARTEAIRATVTNQLTTSVYTSDGRASCTILDLQVKTAQGWEASTAAGCAGAAQGQPVPLAGHASQAATITASGDGFPAGTYRLALGYTTIGIPPQMAGTVRDGVSGLPRPMAAQRRAEGPLTMVYSQAFEIK